MLGNLNHIFSGKNVPRDTDWNMRRTLKTHSIEICIPRFPSTARSRSSKVCLAQLILECFICLSPPPPVQHFAYFTTTTILLVTVGGFIIELLQSGWPKKNKKFSYVGNLAWHMYLLECSISSKWQGNGHEWRHGKTSPQTSPHPFQKSSAADTARNLWCLSHDKTILSPTNNKIFKKVRRTTIWRLITAKLQNYRKCEKAQMPCQIFWQDTQLSWPDT